MRQHNVPLTTGKGDIMSKLSAFIRKIRSATGQKGMDIPIASVIAFLVVFVITVSTNQGIRSSLRPGDISSTDIQLPKNVSLVDEKKTKELWQRIRQESTPIFFHDRSISENISKEIDDFFDDLVRITTNANLSDEEKLQSLQQVNSNISAKDLPTLRNPASVERIREQLRKILLKIYETGYLKISDMYSFPEGATIDIHEKDSLRPGNIGQFYSPENLNLASMATQGFASAKPEEQRLIREYAHFFLRPDTYYDVQRTAARIEEEIKNTAPVMMHLKKGRVIIRQGDEVTPEKMKLIDEINRKIHQGMILNNTSIFLAFLVIFLFFHYAIRLFDHRILQRRNYFYIFLSLSLVWFLATYLLSQSEFPARMGIPSTLLVPIAFISLTFPLFFSLNFSIASVVLMTFISGFLFQNDFIHYIPAFFTGVTGVFISGMFHRKRNSFWLAALYLLLCQVIFLLTMDFILFLSLKQTIATLVVGSTNIIICLIAALGIVSILESIFNAATDFRLLEFSDLNKPTFKQMLLEAPGTYHHSILVANLAEAAALEIGANSLLVKVSAYYHDIGKLAHPDFYIENSSYKNKLEEKDVKPTLYVSIVKQHLKEGIEMGRKIRLPEEVIEVMSQHHGKSLIKFFYFKALNMSRKTDKGLNKEDFKYDSENPKSREAVILLLADSVEAASRSLVNPSFQKIRDQVEEILNSKFSEGLLNESEITLGEIRKIGDAFVKVLVGVFHSRIKYPDDEEIKTAENASPPVPGEGN
jgi:putative nucleotidyltransferase with HDIG domain